MSNELNFGGSFNIGVSSIAAGAEVNITQVLAQSLQYNDLLKQIKTQKKLLALTSATDTADRLEISNEINFLESQLEQFKKDVIKLAEQFELIEINTERLKNAKDYFDKGEIKEAKAVLESELEQMQDEQAMLLEKKNEFEEDILPKLKNNAEEFMMLALLAVTDYENKDRLEKTGEYFKRSIQSFETKQNLIEYGTFLILTGAVTEAGKQFEKFIKKFAGDMTDEEKVGSFVNFGMYYFQVNQYDIAKDYLEQALKILETEPARSFKDYKYSYAAANGNLAIIFQQEMRYKEADEKYLQTILTCREILDDNYQQNASMYIDMLNNHGYLLTNMERFEEARQPLDTAYKEIERFEQKLGITLPVHLTHNFLNYGNLLFYMGKFEKALEQYQFALNVIEAYSTANPALYLPKKCLVLNSIGFIKMQEKKFDEARTYYENAILQMHELVTREPQSHLVNYCMFVVNLCEVYSELKIEKETAVTRCFDVITTLFPSETALPFTKVIVDRAVIVLKSLNLTDEEINRTVNESLQSLNENLKSLNT